MQVMKSVRCTGLCTSAVRPSVRSALPVRTRMQRKAVHPNLVCVVSSPACPQVQLTDCEVLSPCLEKKIPAKHLANSKLQLLAQSRSAAIAVAVASLASIGLLQPATAAAAANPVQYIVDSAAAIVPGILGDSPLTEGFVSGFLLILFSELGDKTFFIAVLLALKSNKSLVFAGTFSALAVMTVISVGLGQVLHEVDELLPETGWPIDDLLAVALLVWFGVRTLQGAAEAEEKAREEEEEAGAVVADLDAGAATSLVLSTFALVFAAEWGDKSFLATIALAAASSPLGVVTGAIAGHGVATAIAVLGGSVLGKYLSERAVQYVGGSLFLVFAAATLVDLVREFH